MKFLFDFFPVVLFFVVYKFFTDLPPAWIAAANQIPFVTIDQGEPKHAILMATLVIILATLLQNVVYFIQHRRLEKMHLITLGLLLVFGSLTLLLKDAQFIKWKVSIINWAFALAFIGSLFVGTRKPLAERMMGHTMNVPAAIWRRVNYGWAGFFTFVGVLNLLIAYLFSEDFWVNFKLFGVLGLTLVFVIIQAVYLQKHAIDDSE